jgi:6-phosphogluconolactonase
MIGTIDSQDDAQALARQAAEWMTKIALARQGLVRIALSGGSTPRTLYSELAGTGFRNRFPWERAAFYWGDERFVPHDHQDSNYRMVREAMLSKVPVPPGNVHPVPIVGTPAAAALAYEQALQAAYGAACLDPARPLFDIVLLGLGEDGHTASLLPGDAALTERRHWAAAVTQGRVEARITLTYPAIESSRNVAFLVAGAAKAAVFKAIRAGDSLAPAARVRPQGTTVWFVDRAAMGE